MTDDQKATLDRAGLNLYSTKELKQEIQLREEAQAADAPEHKLNANDLSVLAYANSFTLWHYRTRAASILTPNYFGQASDMFRVNDLIIANVWTGVNPFTKQYVVNQVSDGKVTIVPYE